MPARGAFVGLKSDGSLEAVRRASGAQPPGLSESHNSAHPYVEFHQNGSLARVNLGKPSTQESRRSRPRGRVSKFSDSSRMRMRRAIAATNLDELPLFVHLTYPGKFECDPEKYKAHLDNFSLRLHRRFPDAGFMWKLEFQKRGAPHFHLFVWGISDCPTRTGTAKEVIRQFENSALGFKEWLSRAWYEVVGSGDERHLRAGTRVERIKSRGRALSYCSGYAAKDDQTLPGQYVGRYWGVCHRANIPWAPIVHLELTERMAVKLRRHFRRFMFASRRASFLRKRALGLKVSKPRIRNNCNITAILDANFWLRRLRKLVM